MASKSLEVPNGYNPALVDSALNALNDFVPHLDRAKRNNIPGWQQLERTMVEHYQALTQMKQDYHPKTSKLAVQ